MGRIQKLDLGGTACFQSPRGVIISADGTTSDDYVTPAIVADYNRAPFASNTFDEAFGCCYFEEQFNLKELYRVLKPGATAKLGACGSFGSAMGADASIEKLMQRIATITVAATQAGFKIRVEDRGGDNSEGLIDHPWFILTKPRRN